MIQSEMGFSDGKRMINNPLNDSEEHVAMEGEEVEKTRATATVVAEVVTRATKNRVGSQLKGGTRHNDE